MMMKLLLSMVLSVMILSPMVLSKTVPVYVMLQLDIVTNQRTVNNPSQLLSQMQQLKSGGVSGVMLDMWWGLIERDGPKNYYWQPYSQIVQLARQAGLKVHAITSFHECGGNVGDTCNVCYLPVFQSLLLGVLVNDTLSLNK
jgi:beta-amylase